MYILYALTFPPFCKLYIEGGGEGRKEQEKVGEREGFKVLNS